MKKLIVFALILLPPPVFAMQGQKSATAYYEVVMGPLTSIVETKDDQSTHVIASTEKGDQLSCSRNSNDGTTKAVFILKNVGEIEPEAFGESPKTLYDSLSKRAAIQALAKAQQQNN